MITTSTCSRSACNWILRYMHIFVYGRLEGLLCLKSCFWLQEAFAGICLYLFYSLCNSAKGIYHAGHGSNESLQCNDTSSFAVAHLLKNLTPFLFLQYQLEPMILIATHETRKYGRTEACVPKYGREITLHIAAATGCCIIPHSVQCIATWNLRQL